MAYITTSEANQPGWFLTLNENIMASIKCPILDNGTVSTMKKRATVER